MIDVHIEYFVYVFNLHKLSLYCIQNKYYVTLLLLSLIVFKMCMMFFCKIVFVPGPHVVQLEVMVSTYSTIHFSIWVIYLTLSWESLDGLLPILYKWCKLQTDVPFGVAILFLLLYFVPVSMCGQYPKNYLLSFPPNLVVSTDDQGGGVQTGCFKYTV